MTHGDALARPTLAANARVALTAMIVALATAARGEVRNAPANPCAAAPGPVSAAVRREPGWSPVQLDSLGSDDRALWIARGPKTCPGFASARLGVGAGVAYAVALIRGTPHGTQEKVVLLIPEGGRTRELILAKPRVVANPAVVWRAWPGKTRAWDGGPTIDVEHDSIVVETIEAMAERFFFVHGRLRGVVTSD